MLNILLLILTTFAHPGGRRCREELVDAETQYSDLTKLLIPFSGAASEGDEETETPDEVADEETETPDEVVDDLDVPTLDNGRRTLQTSDSSTTCVMRGMDASWPHEDASAAPLVRRLLHRRRKQKVKFDVDNQVFGPLSSKQKRDYTCYSDGSVQFSYKSSVVNAPVTPALRRELRRGGGGHGHGHHGHGNHDSSSDSEEDEEVLPYATLTLTQTNALTEGEDPVSFDMSMECHPWYKLEETTDESGASVETCSLQGMRCKDGEYTYFDDSQDEENEDFWGMKCTSDDDFHSNWEECVAVPL